MTIDIQPLVSIIVPVYKAEPYLRRCMDSICTQSLTNIEIITINDASPDGCGMILDEYAKRDPRMRVITHERNRGVAAARNSGLEVAKGKYIGFVDADDFIDENMYELLIGYAEESQADIVYCGFRIAYESGVYDTSLFPEDIRYDLINSVDRRKAFRKLGFSSWNKLFRRTAIYDIRFPLLTFSEDGAFNITCFCRSRIIRSAPCVPYSYFSRQDSCSKIHTLRGVESWGMFVQHVKETLFKCGYTTLWPQFASEARVLILKYMITAIYIRADLVEKQQLWRMCLERSVPILLERGFQPWWVRWWLRMVFKPRSLWLAYWAASVPCRYEESCVGFIRTVVKSFRRRDWRAIAELCHRTTRKAYQPRSS